jgi:GT2 family glycosyltransferase
MVRLIRQPNSGKPAALNTGAAAASHELIVMMDGDTVFKPVTVRELVQPFADPRVGALAGNAEVGNRDTLIGAWQHLEYMMDFNLDRRMYDVLDCMPTIPGAIGAFRRTALQQAGGMSDDTLAEDTDVTMALHRAGWKVVYPENARAWTEAPVSMKQLWSQRYRWSYGTMQAMWKHRHALLERGPAGHFGRVGLPFVALFMVVTPLLAPAFDIGMVYGVVFVDAYKTPGGVVRGDGPAGRLRLVVLPPGQGEGVASDHAVGSAGGLPGAHVHDDAASAITALTGGRLRWQKLKRTGEVGARRHNGGDVLMSTAERSARGVQDSSETMALRLPDLGLIPTQRAAQP